MANSARVWRLIDTGTRRAAENIAFNWALLEARKQRVAPSTLRFLQFTPSALLGYHQSAEQELDLDYCAANAIDVQRRITGGGAIYMDEGQFGWELYLERSDVATADMAVIAKRICDAAARGISSLGVDARFRPRNDIEVNGRKVSGTGGAFDGEALLYQGTLLVEFDVERMVRCLRIPSQKFADKAIMDARERVRDLRDLLGTVPPLDLVKARIQAAFAEAFDVTFAAGDLNDTERRLFGEALGEIDSPLWAYSLRKPRADLPILESTQKLSGGLLHAAVVFDRPGDRIKQVWFTGDFFVDPRRTIADLEAALKDAPPQEVRQRVDRFFQARAVDMLALTPHDFVVAVDMAVRTIAGSGSNAALLRRP